ncbi:MAG TPA: hypothetical protein VKU87_04255 [Thermomicrobiaceae bacterium]|nr:hypothetical protein [Thermomicrobiaceae bacterium]
MGALTVWIKIKGIEYAARLARKIIVHTSGDSRGDDGSLYDTPVAMQVLEMGERFMDLRPSLHGADDELLAINEALNDRLDHQQPPFHTLRRCFGNDPSMLLDVITSRCSPYAGSLTTFYPPEYGASIVDDLLHYVQSVGFTSYADPRVPDKSELAAPAPGYAVNVLSGAVQNLYLADDAAHSFLSNLDRYPPFGPSKPAWTDWLRVKVALFLYDATSILLTANSDSLPPAVRWYVSRAAYDYTVAADELNSLNSSDQSAVQPVISALRTAEQRLSIVASAIDDQAPGGD